MFISLRTITIRLCLLVLASGMHSWGQRAREVYNGREVSSNEVVVRLKNPGSSGIVQLLGDMLPADSIQVLNEELGLVLVHSPSRPVAALLDLFANRGDLFYAEPNFTVQAVATPNDPYLGQLWGIQKIGAPLAWDITRGNSSTVVGVVDTGVNYNHPDLAANMWSAPSAFTVTVGGTKITCPAGSHGINTITMSCDPSDENGHGTHIAGTIGAVGDNGRGVPGINWSTSVMALRFMDAGGSGSISNAIRAINFAIQVKKYFAGTATPVDIRVLSNSWGGSGFSQSLLDAINSAGTNNILFVVAAGNAAANDDTVPTYPASYTAASQISVAATTPSDDLAGFSNYGIKTVHLGAPGSDIVSTYKNDYASLSGTSMATPHVAGAATLVLSACPDLNTTQLKSLLLANVDVIPALAGKMSTGGRLNVDKALQACNASRQPSLSSVLVSPATLQSGQAGSITIGLTGAAGPGGMTVTLSSSNPASVAIQASVTVPAGQSSATISFTAGGVTISTPFTITGSAYGVSKSASGTVNPAIVWVPNSIPASKAGGELAFVTGFSTAFLRNDFTGWVGAQITVGVDPLKLNSVGRVCAPGNSGSHIVKFVNVSDGTDVAGASAAVNMKGCTTNQFVYAALPNAVTLQPGTRYYLVTQEEMGSDQWYDGTSVTSRTEASISSTASRGTGDWSTGKTAGLVYGPLDFLYISAPVPKTVSVSIKSNPINHSLVVDGIAYDSSQVFQWAPGSSHSVSAPTQSTGVGTQSVWVSWSDDGSQSHSIAPNSDMELIASFKAQYYLSTAVTPAGAGTISAAPQSATGYYDAGSTVQLSATSNTGFTLLNWTGDLLGSLFSQTITMSAPRSVTAAFMAIPLIPTAPTTPAPPTPPAAPVTPSNSFINGYALSGQILRNDFSGWVGTRVAVGGAPLIVKTVGRLCVSANSGSHIVKFVNVGTGVDVPGGSVSVNMASCTAGQFQYAALPAALTLPAGSSYYLVSQELQGGDRWYDVGRISTAPDAVAAGGAYSGNGSAWNMVGGINNSYAPPSFQYEVQAAVPGSALVLDFDNTSALRSDFSGWVGTRLTVGANSLTVTSLARMCAPGNSRSHKVKLVRSNLGTEAADGTVQIDMKGCTPGQFVYEELSTPMVLQAKTSYFLVSQEAWGGDQWYDMSAISTSSLATVNSSVYSLLGIWITNGGPATSYGPLNFK